jgi:acetyl-CoA acyltransferase 1
VSSRSAQFLAGISHSVPLYAVNRLCSSGLQAVATIANQIAAGEIEIGIGGGVESMSLCDLDKDPTRAEAVYEHEEAKKTLMPLGITSENVAERYGISRLTQDTIAYESHRKAAKAQKNGWLRKEITAYRTVIKSRNGD